MKISWRPLTVFGFIVSQFHLKINLRIFLFKCPDIDDTLLLKRKKTYWIGFRLKNQQFPLWRP